MTHVSVYTRHNPDCDKRADRTWRKCHCPKWLYWAYQGKRFRVSAKTDFWTSAEDAARKKEQRLRDIVLGQPVPAEQGMTVADSVDRYLAHKRSENLAEPTLYKHKHVLKTQMASWCDRNGIHFLAHITGDKLQQWRNTWEESPITRRNKQERVRGFFRFVHAHGWLTLNPSVALSRIKVPRREPSYFTASELNTILKATADYGKSDTDRQRMRAAVLLMRWSGLAIRDTVCLERSRLDQDDHLILSRAKNNQPVYVPLPHDVAEELRSVPAGLHGDPRYFFWTGTGLPKTAVSDWERAFRRLFKLAKLGKRCHPHMFRHTFSIHLLDAGVPIETVSALLGHASIRTTEKHYKAHTQITQQRISLELRRAWKVMDKRKD
jgi:integrase/recombinase XerD